MAAVTVSEAGLIGWGVAARPFPGERRSGDAHLVRPGPAGVLVAVVDGLGHGDEAADVATIAISVLSEHATEPPFALVRRCHDALLRTRGVAMSLAVFDGRTPAMTWLGVGNVDASLIRSAPGSRPPRESLILRGGVVGYRLPTLHPAVVAVEPGDLLIMRTDGVREPVLDGVGLMAAPGRIAAAILDRFGLETDDALALVARYRGADR
jgi:negative regulator of sigma-B (phosphoserine phosphatase)